MSRLSRKDCGLILFDVNSPKKQTLLEGLLKISVYKWLSSSQDIYRLVLANSKSTDNELKCPNVAVTEIDDLDPREVNKCVTEANCQEGDWLDGILVGIHYLEQAIGMPGLITLQLIYFTTLDRTSKPIDENKVQKIIDKINNLGIYLYIIGPSVKLPFTITCNDDVHTCMQQLIVDRTNPSLCAARQIVQNTKNSVLCNLYVGINLFHSFKNFPGAPPFREPLKFGSHISIPATTQKIYRRDFNFRLIKTKGPKWKNVLAGNEQVEVLSHDVVKGVLRHAKFIPITDNHMFQIKDEDKSSFDVLGFTHKSFVPDPYMTDHDVYYILPDNTGDQFEMFCYLVKILSEERKYIITRRKHYIAQRPRFFVLIPQSDIWPPRFVMVGLPYADDVIFKNLILQEPVPSGDKFDPNLLEFCNSLDVSGNKTKITVPLGPTMTMDLYANELINASTKKIFKTDFDNKLDTDNFYNVGNTEFLDRLKRSWPPQQIN